MDEYLIWQVSMVRGQRLYGAVISGVLVFECFRNTGVWLAAGPVVRVFNGC